MRLNLTMILDRLLNLTIISKHVDKHSPRQLQYPVLYAGETTFSSGKLYVARAEELSEHPRLVNHPSIICVGEIGEVYKEECEYITLPEQTNLIYFFNTLQETFAIFQRYDDTAAKHCSTLQELGELAMEIFGNPVSLYDNHEKLLLYMYDPSRLPYDQKYIDQYMQPGTYMPEEEIDILHTHSAFTYQTRGPQYAEGSDYFSTNALYINFFEEGQYIGRVLVDDSYKPISEADYPCLEWISYYFRMMMLHSTKHQFGATSDFSKILENLILEQQPFPPEAERILGAVGWSIHDQYICACICSADVNVSDAKLAGDALYMNEFFDAHCIVLGETCVYQIFNFTRSKHNPEAYFRRLNLFLRFNADVGGVSSQFYDLGDACYSAQQARYALEQAKKETASEAVSFNNCVLQLMLANVRGNYNKSFYYTDAIHRLLAYDAENNTELMDTVNCFLTNNMHYSEVQEIMHIARTTALYRIRRAQEISGLDFNDPDVRLYLLILFRQS